MNNDTQEVTFEQTLEQLALVVRKLEEGQLGLSDSLAAYEAGIGHVKYCYQALEAAERKIELLSGVDANGNPITKPFDDEIQSLEQKAETRSRRRSAKPAKALTEPESSKEIDSAPGLF